MKAFRVLRYNKKNFADVRLMDVDVPSPSPQQLRVRMSAAAFNPADLHTLSGEMGMMSPVKPPFTLGVDGAGVVEAVGADVRDFQVGDEVFFYTGLVWSGTFAETVMVDARACAAKPAHWSYAQAAAVALALLCADLALERAQVHAGQQILIHGAGGSVGAAAVLLARQRGASVHATGSLDDKSFTEQLGARWHGRTHVSGFTSFAQKRRGDSLLESHDGYGRHAENGNEAAGDIQVSAALHHAQVHRCGKKCGSPSSWGCNLPERCPTCGARRPGGGFGLLASDRPKLCI
jgi:NADPH:quinone reductase-like Zn-dependent oxidoreductase